MSNCVHTHVLRKSHGHEHGDQTLACVLLLRHHAAEAASVAPRRRASGSTLAAVDHRPLGFGAARQVLADAAAG